MYFTILGLSVVKGGVCAVMLGLGGLVASALLPPVYGALATFAHTAPTPSPPIFAAPMSPDAAWTAYILSRPSLRPLGIPQNKRTLVARDEQYFFKLLLWGRLCGWC
jgi:hypothetical protein